MGTVRNTDARRRWQLFGLLRELRISAPESISNPGEQHGGRLSSAFGVGQAEHAPKVDSQQILSFYMGKNTPKRKDYIMENLGVTVEE